MEKNLGKEEVIITLLGTTTLRDMLDAVYNESNPLQKLNTYSECGSAFTSVKDDPDYGNTTVYIYYHQKENETIMTNIKGDTRGLMGSSAGFTGKILPQQLNKQNQSNKKHN